MQPQPPDQPPLHPAIVSLVSLAAGIAANHPAMGQCQLARLRELGVPEHQIATVIDIARHLRDEAPQKLDQAFDEAARQAESAPPESPKGERPLKPKVPKGIPVKIAVATASACCSTTASGQSCC
jgi:hypothetical protein